ncbi:protein vav isoform X1 [Acyrthosiphon pisum]|uniref:Protein vav n=1 Tax=Acyrthosiphon pisum TaxID=7029 RepID=A0A8R2ABI2_ACYPI|nr:protein vav isoform X1 [Acyrthosiphon pisum]|eukprot:XP_001946064.2 PREDICTED: protein vav isoform X1 [Acyrthosiphon pisum]
MANGGWRECTNWLTRCGAIRSDHKVNWPESTIDDLAHTLRDGVILCNLLNILEPGCLGTKDINQKPQMAQFLCLRNIKTFLQVCQEVFDVKEYDIFDPIILFELSDFFKVIRTLSILSQTPKLQRLHIPGFIVSKPRTLSQEDIYRNINSLDLVSSRSALLDSFHENEYTSYDTHIRNEEIYHDLCAIDIRTSLSISEHPVVPQQIIEKRDYVINELVETEKNYVDVLQTLLKCFIKPLIKIMKEDDFCTIFQGIKELHEIHKDFHLDLIKACSQYSSLRLSDVFLNWKDKFLVYADYCANLTTAQDRIQDICNQNEHINREVNRCQEEANNGKFKLRDILSVPMQRILKYHLLLDKLIHDTPQTHKDLPGLEWAKECMVDIAQYINEVKRDSDTLQIMNDVQKSIVDWDIVGMTELKNYGHLIADGELKIKAHNDQKLKPRYVFIFDQVVLMCKSIRFIGFQSDQYSFKQSLLISQYRLEDYTSRKFLYRENRWSYQFHMVHKSESTVYTFYARSEEQKMKWMKAIQDAMDNIEPSVCNLTSHKFVMQTFDIPTVCYHCSKYLKGCIFQGYKCEECFISVHKSCIPESGRCGLISPQSTTIQNTMFSNRFPADHSNFNQRHRSPDWTRNWSDNDTLTEHLWFVGEMDRDRATNLLESESDGTYLVRIRPQGPTRPVETVYALSLKSNNQVKHMKICERLEDGISSFYLSEKRFFPNLVELVNFYEKNSLSENFTGLDIKLKWPFCRILAIAKYNFSPTESNQLPLKEGCTLKILSKEGDQKGWWKGQIGDKIGFFPKVYVQEHSQCALKISN